MHHRGYLYPMSWNGYTVQREATLIASAYPLMDTDNRSTQHYYHPKGKRKEYQRQKALL